MPAPVWSDFRRWMSNLLPLVPVAPLPALALYFDSNNRAVAANVVWASIPVVLWLGINFLALYQNAKIRRALKPLIEKTDALRSTFVGFARPKHKSPIHHHEDVGYLLVFPDKVEFVGESHRHELLRDEIKAIRFRFNLNSIFGLGRWVSIEGVSSGKHVRLMVEPREKPTLLGNRVYGKLLLKDLRSWWKTGR
jgi:hypothetical protein